MLWRITLPHMFPVVLFQNSHNLFLIHLGPPLCTLEQLLDRPEIVQLIDLSRQPLMPLFLKICLRVIHFGLVLIPLFHDFRPLFQVIIHCLQSLPSLLLILLHLFSNGVTRIAMMDALFLRVSLTSLYLPQYLVWIFYLNRIMSLEPHQTVKQQLQFLPFTLSLLIHFCLHDSFHIRLLFKQGLTLRITKSIVQGPTAEVFYNLWLIRLLSFRDLIRGLEKEWVERYRDEGVIQIV